LEIVFIVITFGASANRIGLATVGAVLGGLIVLAAGLVFHRPLSRVPENTIKFAVGVLLSAFGTFWALEGLGVFAPGGESLQWPGGDLAILALLATWSGLAWLTVRALRESPRVRPREVTS
jgi:Ca2+/H+ antiporter, TMEM165/GDT1 family